MDGGGKVAGLVRVTHMDHGLTLFLCHGSFGEHPFFFMCVMTLCVPACCACGANFEA